MRILHVTDLHFNISHFEWVKTKQDEYDVLCLTGDFLDDNNRQTTSIDSQINWISKWVLSLNVPVFICSGNHDEVTVDSEESLEDLFSFDNESHNDWELDTTPLIGSFEWIKNLSNKNKVWVDRQITSINGITFGCVPYGCDVFEKYRSCDVILYHVPPSNFDVAKDNRGDHGCDYIRIALELNTLKPIWILSGHIHQPRKTIVRLGDTSISNPGRGKHAIPKYNVIEI
ncbi:metallophosphoesterase [Psychromonas sp.]|nr:metallophosphoesterase [Psychromonas sp.]